MNNNMRLYNEVTILAFNGQYVSAERGGGHEVVVNQYNPGVYETFNLIFLEGNKYALRVYNGQYMSVESGGGRRILADKNAIGFGEIFYIYSKKQLP